MSTWRQIAIEKVPRHRRLIEESESAGMLWVDLWLRFVEAHRPPADEATVKGIYEFASWCLIGSDDDEIRSSAICHFYEQLPLEPLVRRDLPKHMSRADFIGMTQIFEYHLTAEEHKFFMNEFFEAEDLFRASKDL
jgi:hypothetical protein